MIMIRKRNFKKGKNKTFNLTQDVPNKRLLKALEKSEIILQELREEKKGIYKFRKFI